MSFLWEAQMKPARLILTAAAGLMLGLGAAAAQTDKPAEAASPPPAAIQNAPPDKIAPSMKAGQPNADTHKAPETVGQPPNASDPKGSDPKASDPEGSDPKASDGNKPRALENGTPHAANTVSDANGSAGTKK